MGQVDITGDEVRPKEPQTQPDNSNQIEASSGFTSFAWRLFAFDSSTGMSVSYSKPAFRWTDEEWKVKEDGGSFEGVASVSTVGMDLDAGEYIIVLAFSP